MDFATDAACAARDAGKSLDAIEKAALEAAARTELFFVLDTLDYLVKGGRAGRAQGMAAALLNIKPVLQVTGGVIEPFKKCKGTNKAIREMAEHVAERSRKLGPLNIVVIHAVAENLADELSNAIRSAGTDIATIEVDEIGSVIGTHVGPRTVGVGYAPAK
jgi:DegV family protein with EDD domain